MKLKSTLKGGEIVLSEEMKKKILKQLSLRSPEDILPVLPGKTIDLIDTFTVCGKRLWNDGNLIGDKLGVYGNARGVIGDVSEIKGCLTGIVASAEEILFFLLEEQRKIDEQG